jgi:hypothetical protein
MDLRACGLRFFDACMNVFLICANCAGIKKGKSVRAGGRCTKPASYALAYGFNRGEAFSKAEISVCASGGG